MTLVERIKKLAKENGTNIANLERVLGISNGVIRRWDTASPTCDKLLRIADYFSVSVDELLRDNQNISTSTNNKLISLFNKADIADQDRVIKYLEIVCSLKNATLTTTDTSFQKNIVRQNFSLKSIPIRGYVAAGKPIDAIDNVINEVELPDKLDADYALIVKGNSMDPLIKDGEYVYVKVIEELNNNDIGVFYYNGSVTCKKFFKNDAMIKLISINPTYEDFDFYLDDAKNENINFTIEGKVLLSEEQQKRLNSYFTFNR